MLLFFQQLLRNEFSDTAESTKTCSHFYLSAVHNDTVYPIRISDVPPVPAFPMNNLTEWTHFRCYGLRHATAYILVYDISSIESFQFLKILRDQIYDSRNMTETPVVVVANKIDLLENCDSEVRDRRDVKLLVKKHWKCGYVECSAKYNWKIGKILKELIKILQYNQSGGQDSKSKCYISSSDTYLNSKEKKCIIL